MLLQVYVKRIENRDVATSLCQKKGEQGCCYKSMSKVSFSQDISGRKLKVTLVQAVVFPRFIGLRRK